MTICTNCQGQGHSNVIGDNDIECKVCGGTGKQPVTAVATEVPLSEEAQLRIDLERFDVSFHEMTTHHTSPDQVKYRRDYTLARAIMLGNLSADFHMLLDLLDASRNETAALREQITTLTTAYDELNIRYWANHE